MSDRPNILLFFTDDQRFDTLRALGNERIHTPNLDRLVERGTTFTHAHIPGGTSGAVCMPSRAMLHTGRTLFHLDREGQGIPREHTMMGECFREAGYATFGTGKWHNGTDSYARSFSCGDEIFFGGMWDHWNVPSYHFDPTGRYDNRMPYVTDAFHSNAIMQVASDHIEPGRHSTDLFVDASSRFLEERDAAEPFFMYVSLMAPHDPRTMPREFLEMYDAETIPLPENFLPEHPIDIESNIRDELLAASPREPEEIRRHIAEYYAMITHLDHGFGRLVDALEAHGERENTMIVFAGDNGLAVGQHGLMGKQNLYDHSVRVPLIFAGPGIPEGKRSDELVYLLDIFPTLCELSGADTPDSVEGKSLAPGLRGNDADTRSCLYLAYTNKIRGVTNGRHKLIEYAVGDTQLFDLSRDPSEVENLAGKDSMSEVVEGLRRDLLALSDEWDDENHPMGKTYWAQRADLKP
jgi:arylsulfatase A-like enzyme